MEPKIYLVGGAVRDLALGLAPKDRDYVVVGATPEWMLEKGFKQVGASFPVFLHPTTGEEYALARTERKVGKGYYGFETIFDPSITLEQDLIRRDLTINAMAMATDVADPSIIDPFGGLKDLENKILRHTSEAFREDPLRVLRIARFAARYDFTVAPETIKLCSQIVNLSELLDLSMERIWTELYKGSTEAHPLRMLEVLHDCGALHEKPVADYFGSLHLSQLRKQFSAAEQLNVDFWLVKPALVFQAVASLSADEVQRLKIPAAIVTLVKRVQMTATFLFKETSEEVIFSYIMNSRLDSDASADAAHRWKQVQDITMIHAVVNDRVDILIKNLDLVTKSIGQIKKIDFETLVSTCEKHKIKQSVAAAKQSAVAIVLKEAA